MFADIKGIMLKFSVDEHQDRTLKRPKNDSFEQIDCVVADRMKLPASGLLCCTYFFLVRTGHLASVSAAKEETLKAVLVISIMMIGIKLSSWA